MLSEKCKYCTDTTCIHSPNYYASHDDYHSGYDSVYGHDDWFMSAVDRAWERDQAWRSGAFW